MTVNNTTSAVEQNEDIKPNYINIISVSVMSVMASAFLQNAGSNGVFGSTISQNMDWTLFSIFDFNINPVNIIVGQIGSYPFNLIPDSGFTNNNSSIIFKPENTNINTVNPSINTNNLTINYNYGKD